MYYYYNNLSGISQWEKPHRFHEGLAKKASKAVKRGTKKKGAILKLPNHMAKFQAAMKIQGSYRQKYARKRVREKRSMVKYKNSPPINETN